MVTSELLPVFNLVANIVGVIFIPILVFVLTAYARARREEIEKLVVMAEDAKNTATALAAKVEVRLERIENGLIERITRLEAKLDAHLQWHLLSGKKGD